MAQDGVFKEDLAVGGITVLYDEFLGAYAREGEDLSNETVAIPSQRLHVESPIIYGNGPVEFSTQTALARIYPPYFVWDVEGYYRALGVHHLASRRELKHAFLRMRGHADTRATFIIKTLLNQALRFDYDMLPLGARFIDDPEVQDYIKRQAHLEAQRRCALGHQTTGEAVLAEWGIVYSDSISQRVLIEDGPNVPLSDEDLGGQDEVVDETWCYSFYLWRSTNVDAPLKQWQEALVRAAREQGVVTRLAIGVLGEASKEYVIENIHGRKVVLIGDGVEPSNSLASDAITNLSPHT